MVEPRLQSFLDGGYGGGCGWLTNLDTHNNVNKKKIDYICQRKTKDVQKYTTQEQVVQQVGYSDHYPLIATIKRAKI